ncbi:MAG: hypothetical protein F6J97_02475 [Leptolyngbya sp. SIO4C1]|nr:hypothetical protein [Leptolyngbya sp. SIO4C1]
MRIRISQIATWLSSQQRWRGLIAACVLAAGLIATMPSAIAAPLDTALLAYNIDLEMDKAREEKTVEHYGEPIRDIVQSANQNNENNPERKPTAKSTYERESPLNEALPEQLGKDFSQSELRQLETSDKS